jgi:quinol monooxygenase YgiN
MIILHATINLQPGKRAEALPVFLQMEQASQQEAGCIEYRFVSLLDNPDIFMAVERWESQEALVSHNKSAHMALFQQQLSGLANGASVLKRYDARPIE